MNIVYINHYAGSDKHGMEYRPYFMAKRWVEAGHNVTIVASSYSHLRTKNPGMRGQATMEEMHDGIRYFWIAGPSLPGKRIGQNKQHALLPPRAEKIPQTDRGAGQARCGDRLLDISAGYLSRAQIAKESGALLIYEVHDLWPLSPIELGGMSPHHPYIVLMQMAENYCYKHSDYVVSLLPCAEGHMKEHGLANGKFVYIPNGIVKRIGRKRSGNPPVYADKLGQYHRDGWFLIGYTGAHGIANGLDSFVEAGKALQGKKIKLILVGQGPERDRLIQKVKDLHLEENVELLPAVKRDAVPELLAQFDALYVGLQRQPLFRFGVSPNKLMDYMMAGKPVIFAIDAGNDMVADASCGISIEPENSAAIAKAAIQLAETPQDQLQKMGARGKAYILEHHEYGVLAKQFLDVFSLPKREK